jgi:hypothetical protein
LAVGVCEQPTVPLVEKIEEKSEILCGVFALFADVKAFPDG